MCLYPRLIKNKKYTANKKNGGVIPPVNDERVLYVPTGCGKCMECRKMKKREWQVRLHEEIKNNKMPAYFVTLTYNNEELNKLDQEVDKELKGYNRDNEIARLSVRRFTERWRKKHKKTIRHWIVTEIGTKGTERLHLHGVLWTKTIGDLKDIWRYGHIYVGDYVNEKTINYIVKYLSKSDKLHAEYVPKMFVSRGIGKGYLNKKDIDRNKYEENGKTNEVYRTREGLKLALPIYYRNYIYNEEEREKLWLQKLDKKERWVNGERIDISKTDKEYYKALNYGRIRNKIMGYGDNSKNWELKKYENDRRNIKRIERIKNKYK